MAVFTPETDHSCEMGYPFDNSRQIGNASRKCNGFYFEWTIRMTLSANFDGQFEDELSVPDSLCTAAPSPQKKTEKGSMSVGEGATVQCTEVSLRRMIHFLALVWKRPKTKFPCPVFLIIQKGLYRTTVCRDLSVASLFRAANTFRVTWPERVFFFLRCATEMPWPRLRRKTPYRD